VGSGELKDPDEFIRKADGGERMTDLEVIESGRELFLSWKIVVESCLERFRAVWRAIFILENLVRLSQFLSLRQQTWPSSVTRVRLVEVFNFC